MADSPNKERGTIVRCSVYSEGKVVGPDFRLISVLVEQAVNRIGKAELLYEAGDMPSATVAESDNDTFAVGKNIRIEAGYDNDQTILFEGRVVTHGLEIGTGNEGFLRIECRDLAFPMTLGRRSRVLRDTTDSGAIQTLLGDHPALSPSVDSTRAKHGELVQYYCSDWDFMLSLADRNGLIVVTEGTKISVKAPAVGSTPALRLEYGPDIISFQAEVSGRDQIPGIRAAAWDPTSQKVISTTASAPVLNQQGGDDAVKMARDCGIGQRQLQTVCAPDADTLKGWAESFWFRAGMGRIQGEVTFTGTAKAVCGCMIELDGFGKHFNGKAYIGSIEHEIRDGDWKTTAHMGITDEPILLKRDVTPPPAAGLLPGIEGLHIGKVTKLNGDPEKNYRIQVEIHSWHGNNNQVWARMASPWAGNKYGSFLIPDVDDEVVVGFFNNDPCYAVILGSLYSSSQCGPYELTEKNHTRGLVSREGMKLTLDEENKIITAETPGGSKIEISDKGGSITLSDKNRNEVVMDDNGITLRSPGDITINSEGSIALTARKGVELKASANVAVKGNNIEAKANMALKMQGGASSEISASGTTVVKGAMVMIN